MLGVGSDESPLIVSMTSKTLLSVVTKLEQWELPVLLHMDGTFKLNENEFPVIVLGVTDAAQQLHVMSLSVVSHRTQAMYDRLVQGFKNIVNTMFPEVAFMPDYIMTDAELAERNALVSVFPEAETLMCYFHVKKACDEKLRGKAEKLLILNDIQELHMCASQQEFDTRYSRCFNHWLRDNSDFAMYFHRQWVQGPFNEWQIFQSAPGCATTNNAIESFNSTLKKYFTNRKRFKIGKWLKSAKTHFTHFYL